MPLGFYGFDFGGYPTASRLFNPQVMQRAQRSFNQGFGQFQQFDPSLLQREQEPAPQQQVGMSLSDLLGDKRSLNLGGNNARVYKTDNGYELSTLRGGGGQGIYGRQIQLDDTGRLAPEQVAKLGDNEFMAYQRLLAQLGGLR